MIHNLFGNSGIRIRWAVKRLVVSREKNSIRFRNRSRVAVTVAVTVTVTTVTELSMLPCKTKEVKIERIVEEGGKNLLFICVVSENDRIRNDTFSCLIRFSPTCLINSFSFSMIRLIIIFTRKY